ncbi:ubiquitin binding protein [Aureococcus anophagefferens]|uniref:Ubiquitin binding protein n=1 Tax=Aureococcus anophagefferens TaxID=44056 RepID=A0ABR1FNL7_AURAN
MTLSPTPLASPIAAPPLPRPFGASPPRAPVLRHPAQRKQQLGDYGADDDDAPRPPHVAGAFDDFCGVDDDDGGAAAAPPSLATMFSPPTRLMHPGDFQAARAQGKAELKWLLVVITNEQVFGCHQMNRDAWADETVQAVVEASFVLWLRPHTDPAAVTYADRYDKDRAIPQVLEPPGAAAPDGDAPPPPPPLRQIWAHPKHPHLAVVDPRTGRRLWMREGVVDRDRLVELLIDVVERHDLEAQPVAPVDSSRRSLPLGPAPPPAAPPPFAGGAVLGGGAGSAFAAPPLDEAAASVATVSDYRTLLAPGDAETMIPCSKRPPYSMRASTLKSPRACALRPAGRSNSSVVNVGFGATRRQARDAAAKRVRDAPYARSARGTGGTFGVAYEQQFVTESDCKYGQAGTEAEVAAQAALDAIRADGRPALDAEAEQAAWEGAWIAATVANLERMKSEKDVTAQAVEVKGYVPPLGGKVSGAVESYAQAASTGNVDHFASTAGSFKGKDRDFKSMAPSSGPDWLSGSAAPAAAAPAAAVASPAASTGNMDHFAHAGLAQGQGPRLQVHGPSSGPDWLSGSAAPRPPPPRPRSRPRRPPRATWTTSSTAGSLKGKDRDFKSMGASSGPGWLSGSAAPRPPPRGRGRVPGGLHGQHGPLRVHSGLVQGQGPRLQVHGRLVRPRLALRLGRPAATAPAAAVASPAASTGNMDHFASTAGSLKGKDRDFKSMGASSGPDWLSGSSMGASSGPDWLSGSAAPAAALAYEQ